MNLITSKLSDNHNVKTVTWFLKNIVTDKEFKLGAIEYVVCFKNKMHIHSVKVGSKYRRHGLAQFMILDAIHNNPHVTYVTAMLLNQRSALAFTKALGKSVRNKKEIYQLNFFRNYLHPLGSFIVKRPKIGLLRNRSKKRFLNEYKYYPCQQAKEADSRQSV